MGLLPTMKVVADTPSGYMIINVSDYDQSKHQVYSEPEYWVESKPFEKKKKRYRDE